MQRSQLPLPNFPLARWSPHTSGVRVLHAPIAHADALSTTTPTPMQQLTATVCVISLTSPRHRPLHSSRLPILSALLNSSATVAADSATLLSQHWHQNRSSHRRCHVASCNRCAHPARRIERGLRSGSARGFAVAGSRFRWHRLCCCCFHLTSDPAAAAHS